MRHFAAAAAAILVAACGRAPSPDIALTGPPAPVSVEVRGLPARDLRALNRTRLSNAQWQNILRVEVEGSQGVAVAGSYQAQRGALRFTPMYGFDAGRRYVVTFDPGRIPGANKRDPWRKSSVQRTLTIDAAAVPRTTYVRQVYPSGDQVPENTLRFYIEFSAPMGRGGALEHIRLIEEGGQEVVTPFLPVEAEFWNADRTRFTLFFDPGRVKRGIKPNRDLGRALVAGKRYELVISETWADGRGQPLKSGYRRAFRAGPPREEPLSPQEWNIKAPGAGTRDPLVMTFPWPVDAGLLQRAISVRRAVAGSSIELVGDVQIELTEIRWSFVQRRPWDAGNYSVVVQPILEDPAGNRIGRAFEVMNGAAEKTEPIEMRFTVR